MAGEGSENPQNQRRKSKEQREFWGWSLDSTPGLPSIHLFLLPSLIVLEFL